MNILKVQRRELRNEDPSKLVDPAIGKFTHIAVTGIEVVYDEFARLLEYAKSKDMGFFWWFMPGRWNDLKLDDRFNIKHVWPGAPKDWANLSKPEVREILVERAMETLADFPDLDGILLDYIRYPWNVVQDKPDLFSIEDVTTAVSDLHAVMKGAYPNKPLIGNVKYAPDHVKQGQDWPTWLRRGIVDGVNLRVYKMPGQLRKTLRDGVEFIDAYRQALCYAPGGCGKHGPMTKAQMDEYAHIAEDEGYTQPLSVFAWSFMENHWHLLPDVSDVPVDPPDPPLVVGTYLAEIKIIGKIE